MQGERNQEAINMAVEERLRAAGVQVEGTFDVQRFFDTLARILSARENMDITVRVLPNEGETEAEEKKGEKCE